MACIASQAYIFRKISASDPETVQLGQFVIRVPQADLEKDAETSGYFCLQWMVDFLQNQPTMQGREKQDSRVHSV